MNASKIINIISEANIEAELKVVSAWNSGEYSLNTSENITAVRFCAGHILLDRAEGEVAFTPANLIALLNAFKGLDVKVKATVYPFGEKDVDGIIVTDKVIYLCDGKVNDEVD